MSTSSSMLFVVCFGAAAAFMLAGYQEVKTPPAANVTVALNEASATTTVGVTTQFSAHVLNATNPAVTWSVDTVVGGSPILGTINTSGLYTAPIAEGMHVVTATSVAAPSASASATVIVSNPSLLSPASAHISAGKTRKLNP
jgi:hypothetical protein